MALTPRQKTLNRVFHAAARLNARLWEKGVDSARMSVAEFAEIVSAECKVTISFKLVDVETSHVLGLVEVYDDGARAVIYLVKSEGLRSLRAVGVKELCQLALDTREDWQPDGLDTLQRLVTPIFEPEADENFAWRSEEMAETLSWELLYPFEFRDRDYHRCKHGETTFAAIATQHEIPEAVVQRVLSPPYLAWARGWWSKISADLANANAAE